MKVILASSSVWRRHLFQLYWPDVVPSNPADIFLSPNIDEKAIRHDDPRHMCLMIAEAKLRQGILPHFAETVAGADFVITCDQVVLFDGHVREKPVDATQARDYLESYARGGPAECLNGLVVHHVPSGKTLTALDSSSVSFKSFPDSVIDAVIESGVAMQTAGGFSVGDVNSLSKYVDTIIGDIPSIEGFPLYKLQEMMRDLDPSIPRSLLKTYHKIKSILFDMDGLLLDTETFYSTAQQKILDRFGITFTMEVKAMMMGRKAQEAADVMIDHYGLHDKITADAFLKERESILDELFPKSELLPGVERLLLHLHSHGVPMAIATSSHRRNFNIKTKKHQDLFGKVFKVMITGDMVSKSKPEPDIFQEALRRLELGESVKAEDTLVFEDAVLGVEAAKAAGMKCVMVSNMTKPQNSAQPDLYIGNMLYFLPEQFGLPPLPRT